MERIDVYVNRQPFAHATMHGDQLEAPLTMRGKRKPATRRPTRDARCPHERVVEAFAYRRSRDEHWPIRYCIDCFEVVAGADPLARATRPRWKFDERNLAIARWLREWPKRGRPRLDAPPAEIAWPDAA